MKESLTTLTATTFQCSIITINLVVFLLKHVMEHHWDQEIFFSPSIDVIVIIIQELHLRILFSMDVSTSFESYDEKEKCFTSHVSWLAWQLSGNYYHIDLVFHLQLLINVIHSVLFIKDMCTQQQEQLYKCQSIKNLMGSKMKACCLFSLQVCLVLWVDKCNGCPILYLKKALESDKSLTCSSYDPPLILFLLFTVFSSKIYLENVSGMKVKWKSTPSILLSWSYSIYDFSCHFGNVFKSL